MLKRVDQRKTILFTQEDNMMDNNRFDDNELTMSLRNNIETITILGEYNSCIESTFRITNSVLFLNYFPNRIFDEEIFFKLLKKGVFDGVSCIEFESHSMGELSDDIKLSNYKEVYEIDVF